MKNYLVALFLITLVIGTIVVTTFVCNYQDQTREIAAWKRAVQPILAARKGVIQTDNPTPEHLEDVLDWNHPFTSGSRREWFWCEKVTISLGCPNINSGDYRQRPAEFMQAVF